MEELTLSVEPRQERGKGAARRLRAKSKLPGVLYGLGNSMPITVNTGDIRGRLLEEGGRNKILKLQGTGVSGKSVLIKDYQVDPLSRSLVHVDLLEIDVTKKIEVTVPLNVIGKSVGVAEGGVLNMVEREIEVRCLPTQIPQHIDVDVTILRIGDSIHLDQLTLPEGIERVSQMNSTLVTVVPPTKEEELAPSLAPSAEPEVITEKKEATAEGEGAVTAPQAPEAKVKKEEKEKKK